MASDYEDDHFISDNLKVGTIYEEDYEPLRHTQYFNVIDVLCVDQH